VSGAELIWDKAHGLVLSWETQYRTVTPADTHRAKGYGVSDGRAATFASAAVRSHYKGKFSRLRCQLWHTDHGGGPEFDFNLQPYASGVKLPTFIAVNCSGHTGHAARSVFVAVHDVKVRSTFYAHITLKAAVLRAAQATGFKQWQFESAVLGADRAGHIDWIIRIHDTTPFPPGVAGEHGTDWMDINPVTGNVDGGAYS